MLMDVLPHDSLTAPETVHNLSDTTVSISLFMYKHNIMLVMLLNFLLLMQ